MFVHPSIFMKLAQQEPEQASSVKPQPQGEGKGRSGELQSNVAPLWTEEEHAHKRYTHAPSSQILVHFASIFSAIGLWSQYTHQAMPRSHRLFKFPGSRDYCSLK